MKTTRIGVVALSIAVLMVLAGWMPNAAAQGRWGAPQLAPEKAEAAWQLEAGCVAKALELSEENTQGLVDAYKAARTSHQEGIQALFTDTGGDRGSRFQAFREFREKELGKLDEALKGILTEAQAAKAIVSLGTFDRRWDGYVDTLAGFELGDEKLTKALVLVNQYVVDADKVMREAMANQDLMSMREARRELKEKLDTALAAVLSEDEQAKWGEATAFRGPGQ